MVRRLAVHSPGAFRLPKPNRRARLLRRPAVHFSEPANLIGHGGRVVVAGMKRTPIRILAAGALALVAATATASTNTGPATPQGGQASDVWCYEQKIHVGRWESIVRDLEPQCDARRNPNGWACESLGAAKERLREERQRFDYWGCTGRYLAVDVDGIEAVTGISTP